MLNWFRARAAGLAGALLLSLATLGYSLVIPHEGHCQHDADCVLREVEHDASAHRFAEGGADPAAPLHCLACHLTRSFRPGPVSAHHAAPSMTEGGSVHIDNFMAVHPSHAAQPPLRSPPDSPVAL